MQTMDQSLADLVKRKIITRDEAMLNASVPPRLAQFLQSERGTVY